MRREKVLRRADKIVEDVKSAVGEKEGRQSFLKMPILDSIINGKPNAEALYKKIADANITINFQPSTLELLVNSGMYKSAFELTQSYPSAKKTDGRMCEELYGNALPTPTKDNPKTLEERRRLLQLQPRFLGLNIGQSYRGAAPVYGGCSFWFKEEIKKDCTLLPCDSALIGSRRITQEQKNHIMNGIGYFDDRGLGFLHSDSDKRLWPTLLSKMRLLESLAKGDADARKAIEQWISGIMVPNEDLVHLYQELGQLRDEDWYSLFEAHYFKPLSLNMVEGLTIPFELFGHPDGLLAMRLGKPSLYVIWYVNDFKGFIQPNPFTAQYSCMLKLWDHFAMEFLNSKETWIQNTMDRFNKVIATLPLSKTKLKYKESKNRARPVYAIPVPTAVDDSLFRDT